MQSLKINRAIGVLQLELRSGINQSDGSTWYALVNKAADSQGKLGTKYSHAQIQLFKAMVCLWHTRKIGTHS